VLYVGKAKNLKNRVQSYFQINALPKHKRQMVLQAFKLKYQVLNSELEALLTEAELIRTYQPAFNILLKDDKSPLYIQITKEKYPRVLQVRKNQPAKNSTVATILGPFSSGYQVKQVLTIARKIFPWCNQANKDQNKPCFYYHIDLCGGACCKKMTIDQYQQMIQNLVIFLKGKSSKLIAKLKKQMLEEAKKENYTLAAKNRDAIKALLAVTQETYKLKPDLQFFGLATGQAENRLKYLSRLLKLHLGIPAFYPLNRIEGYDVSNIQGTAAAVVAVVFIKGKHENQEDRRFNIKTLNTPNDVLMLQEALARRQNHPEWQWPNLIVVDGGKSQVKVALKTWQVTKIPIIGIAKKPDRLIIPPKENSKNPMWQIIKPSPEHPGFNLIQEIRDQAHHSSRKQHRLRKMKISFT